MSSGRPAVGPQEEQAQDELREAEPRPALLLRQEHHPQDGGQALRLPLCVQPAGPARLRARGAARHAGRQRQEPGLSDGTKYTADMGIKPRILSAGHSLISCPSMSTIMYMNVYFSLIVNYSILNGTNH